MSDTDEMNHYVFHALWDTGDKTNAAMMLFQSPAGSTARERGIQLLGLTRKNRLIAATIIETSPELADALRQRGLAMHTVDA